MRTPFNRVAGSSTIVLGIVGGIGSGKSYTTAEFVAQGAERYDADQEAKRLYEDPSILEKVISFWPSVVDSSAGIDFQALAKIVFAPTAEGRKELERLNRLIRPRLFENFSLWLSQKEEEGKEFVVLDAPLLFEAGWETFVDFVVFVDASEKTRLRRVAQRGWQPDELKKRESRQLDAVVKKKKADFIVSAEQDDSHMAEQVAGILHEIRRRAPKRTVPSIAEEDSSVDACNRPTM